MRKKTEAENKTWSREAPEIVATLNNGLPAWMQPACLPGRSHACLPGWVPTCPPSCMFSCVASAFLPALRPTIITISCVFADTVTSVPAYLLACLCLPAVLPAQFPILPFRCRPVRVLAAWLLATMPARLLESASLPACRAACPCDCPTAVRFPASLARPTLRMHVDPSPALRNPIQIGQQIHHLFDPCAAASGTPVSFSPRPPSALRRSA